MAGEGLDDFVDDLGPANDAGKEGRQIRGPLAVFCFRPGNRDSRNKSVATSGNI